MVNIASGDTTQQSRVLWGQSDHIGDIIFEYSTYPNFQVITGKITAKITDTKIPVKVKISRFLSCMEIQFMLITLLLLCLNLMQKV
ncbi:hypothetical protein [Crocosphaera sp. XPORK-15E]|uniref:hypothetical protein n=1 Tax=Crocosphaera sp. XPORK-15E TaxID=3110247 RepID=UPI002B218D7B|nr:hypothetical protein [Crocosphaera sp. XPORK-15E]MEA5535667.1 hypothetical protein [Crocosphaera sp. XPORK-15E]